MMLLSRLIEFFSTFSMLPVEIEDVRDQIVELGVQDSIIIRPVDIDPTQLMGLYYQFKTKKAPYNNIFCSLVLYSSQLSLDWQRVVCCKEMVHILDPKAFKTSTDEQVFNLAARLTRDGTIVDFPASIKAQAAVPSSISRTDIEAYKDFIALYQALAVLMPQEIVEDLRPAYVEGRITAATIAEQAQIPVDFVPTLMSDQWEQMRKMLALI